jgi:hypothetical protein
MPRRKSQGAKEFKTEGKSQFRVCWSGADGKGNEGRIVFAAARRRWRGITLDRSTQTATWKVFRSRNEANAWIDDLGQSAGDYNL